jgi:ABC-type phosphate transport system permease subunit
MKGNYLFNILAIAGIGLTIAAAIWLYRYNLQGKLSSVLFFGTLPILLFLSITSIIQLARNFRKGEPR